MTLTAKDSTQLTQAAKPGAPSQNSENKPGQTTRSNPVCLEVEITIRSLPGEAGSISQPIRETGKTVIVFDNGAVIRSTTDLPAGLKVILSNSIGRDVVCRVVSGRTAAQVKGYVEVEFLETVSDFWRIHEDLGPVPVALPAPPINLQEAPESATTDSPLRTSPFETPAKPLTADLGSAPGFDDIPGLLSTPFVPAAREAKTELSKTSLGASAREGSDYNLSEIAKPTSLANWDLSGAGTDSLGKTSSDASQTNSASSAKTAGARDFMSKGLMAYEQPNPSPSATAGRMPLIVGAAVLAVVAISGAAFYLRRARAPEVAVNTAVLSQPSAPVPPAPVSGPEPAPLPQDAVSPAQVQNQAQPIAGAPSVQAEAQPASVSGTLPDIVIGSATENPRTDARNSQRQEKKAPEIRKAEAPPPVRPAMQNLKMNTPLAPRPGGANSGEASAPIADISASAGTATATPAGLLSSAGRTSKPPVPPPGATVVFDTATVAPPAPAPATPAVSGAAGTATNPKLISSAHVNYPTSARESRVQGAISLALTIDAAGTVIGAKPLSGPPTLRQAAVDSAKQWKYSPAMQDGKPVPSQVIVNIDFRLN